MPFHGLPFFVDRFDRYWGKGPALQMYIYHGMWSRPAGRFVYKLQTFLLKQPVVLTILASATLIFETGFIFAPFFGGAVRD